MDILDNKDFVDKKGSERAEEIRRDFEGIRDGLSAFCKKYHGYIKGIAIYSPYEQGWGIEPLMDGKIYN